MQASNAQLAIMCDPFWSQKSGFCADANGQLVRQAGLVVRVAELTTDTNQWIPGMDNRWIFAAGFLMTLLSIRGLLR